MKKRKSAKVRECENAKCESAKVRKFESEQAAELVSAAWMFFLMQCRDAVDASMMQVRGNDSRMR